MGEVHSGDQPIQFEIGGVQFSAEELQKCISEKSRFGGRSWANIKLSLLLGKNVNEAFVKELLGNQSLEMLQKIQEQSGKLPTLSQLAGKLVEEKEGATKKACREFVEEHFEQKYGDPGSWNDSLSDRQNAIIEQAIDSRRINLVEPLTKESAQVFLSGSTALIYPFKLKNWLDRVFL